MNKEPVVLTPAANEVLGDYAKIERAIEFIRRSASDQPSLAEVAAAVHSSEFHLQRLFSRWAGVSPKRFLQVLTIEFAKERLQESADLLSASLDAGLSSPSRLHDLFVTIEAMTPGEFKNGGSGIEIRHGVRPSPLGTVFVAGTERGICRLEFVESGPSEEAALARLKKEWPAAKLRQDDLLAEHVVDALFTPRSAEAGTRGARAASPEPLAIGNTVVPAKAFHLLVRGTNLQVQVWRALLRIPAGAQVSYQQLARAVGYPQAVRAVASAVGANPVGFLIPCHRVLRNNGALGGYRWGEARKLAARVWESREFLAEGQNV